MRPYSTFFMASAMALSPIAAMAAEGDKQCVKGSDVRQLEILKPGNVGAACDLRYTRDAGGNVAIPYHANNNAQFCATKADEIIGNLVADGFQCTALTVATAGSSVEAVSQTETVAAVEQPAAPAKRPQPTIEEIIQSTEAETASLQIEQPAPVIAEVAENSIPAVEKTENLTTTLPAATTDARGPIDLTAEARPVAQRAPVPAASSVGRVVGSAPDPDRVARIEQAEARADGIQNTAGNAQDDVAQAPAPVTEPAQVATQQAVAPAAAESKTAESEEAKPKRPTRVRPAPAIIKGVLNAQAAAWNEGDLEAFMAGYWNNRDLRFVSDQEVTRGWSQTLKRYQKKYAGESMGVLAFEKLDVQMLTDDVAIVVGRFNLDHKSEIGTGTFSLVMRQFDGRWRIVHDHTVSDGKAKTVAN